MDRQAQLELILDHYERPRFRGQLDVASIVMQGHNPACGDRVRLFVQFDEHGQQIKRLQWEGEGCTISQAAASLTAELMQGASVEAALALESSDLIEWFGEEVVTARLRCVMLPLYTLRMAIRTYRNQQTTDEIAWAKFEKA